MLIAEVDPEETPEDPDEYYDHQLIGLDVRHRWTATPVGEVTEVVPPARPGPARGRAAGRQPRCWCRSSREIVPDGRPGGPAGGHRPARRPDRRPRAPRTPAAGVTEQRGMRIDVVTIFPEYLAPLNVSLVGKARARGLLDVRVHDLRALDPRRAPHGRRHPVRRRARHGDEARAVGRGARRRRWPTGPAGPAADPGRAHPQRACRSPRSSPQELRRPSPGWCSRCGRYEGIDRAGDRRGRRPGCRSTRSRIGDYVLAGGEVAVLVMVEAVARLLPGVLGNAESPRDDSFAPARWRPARGPGLHQARRVARPRGAGGAAQRQPRRRSPAGGATQALAPHRRAPARPARRAASPAPSTSRTARRSAILRPAAGTADSADFGRAPTLWQNRPLLSVAELLGRPVAGAPATGDRTAGRCDPQRTPCDATVRRRPWHLRGEHHHAHARRRRRAPRCAPTSRPSAPVTPSRSTSGSSRATAPVSRSSRAS